MCSSAGRIISSANPNVSTADFLKFSRQLLPRRFIWRMAPLYRLLRVAKAHCEPPVNLQPLTTASTSVWSESNYVQESFSKTQGSPRAEGSPPQNCDGVYGKSSARR